jgi:hypothetical protein
MTCKSEFDSGSDYKYSRHCKDKYDEEILGIFFSLAAANRCARARYCEMCDEDGDEEEEEDEEDEEDEDEDSNEPFTWEQEVPEEGNEVSRIYVEQRHVEDASDNFHP